MKAHEVIVNELVKMIEESNSLPWEQPWVSTFPQNPITGTEYKGGNKFFLSFYKEIKKYKYNLWITFNEAKKEGYKVKKGAKSVPIMYYQFVEKEVEKEENGEIKKVKESYPILRYYRVFNIQEIENVPQKILDKWYNLPNIKIETKKVESILDSYEDKPVIFHDMDFAYYVPKTDEVHLPDPKMFKSEIGYYQTLFHELIHSTGHSKRLNRNLKYFNESKEGYSKEELIAEIGSAGLMAYIGEKPNYKNSVAYIKGWMKWIKDNSYKFINAVTQANKAIEYIVEK